MWSLQIDPTSPTTKLYIGRDNGVYHTTDDGVSWIRFGNELPNAQVYEIHLNTKTHILGAGTHGRGLWEISVP